MKDISQIFKSEIKIEDVKQENGIFCCMNDHFVSGDSIQKKPLLQILF